MEISVLGKVTLQFSDTMVTKGLNISAIDSSTMHLYIQPSMQRDKEEHYKPNQLNFTWNTTSFDGDQLKL